MLLAVVRDVFEGNTTVAQSNDTANSRFCNGYATTEEISSNGCHKIFLLMGFQGIALLTLVTLRCGTCEARVAKHCSAKQFKGRSRN